MALKTNSSEQRERQSAAARKAYDTIVHLSHKLDLSETEKEKLYVPLQSKGLLSNLESSPISSAKSAGLFPSDVAGSQGLPGWGDVVAWIPVVIPRRVRYLTAPPRVSNYLERPESLCALRNTLFAEDHRQPIALTALDGMGGIGKTVLGKALTEDPVVQRAFPEGIVWITAGKEARLH